jgi:hypothetical protein
VSESATISQDVSQALGDVARAAGGVVAPGTEAKSEGRTRNEKGQFGPKKSDAEVRAILEAEFPDDFKRHSPMGKVPEVQPKAGDLPASGAKEESKEAEAPPDRELAKADAFLTSRAKVSPAVLSKLDGDGRKALAKELKEQVAEQQRLTQQLADMRKASPTPQVGQEERGSKVSQPTDSPSLAPLKEAMKGIADLYGEEAAAPLEKAFNAMASRLDAIEQRSVDQLKTATQTRLNEAREALQERFPQLEDEDAFQEAFGLAAMYETYGRGSSSTLAGTKALLEKAARELEWQPFESAKPNKDQEHLALLQSNGTASSRTKPGQRPAATKDEKAEAAARFALDPTVSVEDARKRIASM